MEELTDTVFSHASDTKTPQGILCVVEQMNHKISELTSAECPLIMVLDHLQDPGNLGTILRTAEGAGVTGILMDRECVDIYNPKTIRSTMGSVYRMPFVYVEDLGKGIQDLKDKGITTYAAHLEGKHSYDEENLTNPCAFLIGNEGNGLRREIAEYGRLLYQDPDAWSGRVVECRNRLFCADVRGCKTEKEGRLIS